MEPLSGSQAFKTSIASLVERQTDRWFQTPTGSPDFLDRYSVRQKLERQREFDLMLKRTPGSLKSYEEMDSAARRTARARVSTLVSALLSGEESPHIKMFAKHCERNTEVFVRSARKFDPFLGDGEIHQALRNLWVFNSIQLYLDRAVTMTPSSFAYSLLYPYSDNWLDAAGKDAKEVEEFVDWLSRRLHGVAGDPTDNRAVKVSRLIRLIEDEYPRQEFSDVHHSLIAIHAAQMRSMCLRQNGASTDEEVLLPITIEKGGASVLADGFLAAGILDEEESDIIFAYGVLLQLIDDLQDIDEDRRLGYSSPFTRAIDRGDLEEITARLIQSLRISVDFMATRSPAWGEAVCRLMMRSCMFLIFEAVARYRNLYSERYLTMMEEFMPLPLSYLGNLRNRMGSQSALTSEIVPMVF
jgi:hypothetical protein